MLNKGLTRCIFNGSGHLLLITRTNNPKVCRRCIMSFKAILRMTTVVHNIDQWLITRHRHRPTNRLSNSSSNICIISDNIRSCDDTCVVLVHCPCPALCEHGSRTSEHASKVSRLSEYGMVQEYLNGMGKTNLNMVQEYVEVGGG